MAQRKNRSWVVPAAIATTALVASLGAGTLGAYSASITNDTNTASSGVLTLQESGVDAVTGDPVVVETDPATGNVATVSNINKYTGESLTSTPSTETVTMTNTGDVDATGFTLSFDTCTSTVTGSDTAPAASLCDDVQVTVTNSAGTTVAQGTATSLNGSVNTLDPLAAGASEEYTFSLVLPEDTGSQYMGQTISQPMTWNLSA